jgi:transcriptional regulator with XRE-family HTH domain
MSNRTNRTDEVENALASSSPDTDASLPIGTVLKKLRGERTLRDVQKGTGIANSYLCNVELGYQQPGLKFLRRMADYYQVSMADIIRHAEDLRDQDIDPEQARVAEIERGYRFMMDDPRLKPCKEPDSPLPIEAKRHIVRVYELLTGNLLLKPGLAETGSIPSSKGKFPA